MRLCGLAASMFLVVAPLFAQRDDPGPTLRFEVASIKPAPIPVDVRSQLQSVGGACALPFLERSGNRVHIPVSQLCGLIRVAYDVADYQVIGIPNREASIYFEIEARGDSGRAPSLDDTRLMLQAMLAERFQLRVHREARDMPIYALTIAKGGPKAAACSNPEAPSVYSPGFIVSCKPPMPMTRIAQFLSRETGRPVIDRTGLGTYAFELHWLPEAAPPQPDSPPVLFTAIQEQLGLTLEPQRGPIDSIVVDHAERPSPN
ncbi:MAG TPA: TIGR03435 family protein [Vicinamibacterales bacterium]|nr:TIGR03435 family protein [Vicinamibacterales bacterium]